MTDEISRMFPSYGVVTSGTLYSTASQAAGTNVHLLCTLWCLYTYSLNVSFPHMIRSSMRMAYIIAKVNSLIANSTFCHDHTSLTTN